MESIKEAGKIIKSDSKGESWIKEALPVLVDISRQIKQLETRLLEETEPFRATIDDIRKNYDPALKPLHEMSSEIRKRVMQEHEGSETVAQEGIGKLIFPEKWGYEVADFSKVDKKYRMEVVNDGLISEEIKNGVRKIRGLEIKKVRSLRVLTDSE